jgi:hypothetical protein
VAGRRRLLGPASSASDGIEASLEEVEGGGDGNALLVLAESRASGEDVEGTATADSFVGDGG